MTVYNWIGGPDNLANNPQNWSPTGLPQPGDAAALNVYAVMNIWDNALHWDNVYLNGDGDSSQSLFGLNVLGANAFNVLDGSSVGQGPVTISIEANSYWVGSFIFQNTGGSAVIQGTGGFYNGDSFVGNNTIINAPVDGSGTFALLPTHPVGARLEFMQSVDAGQSVAINGYAEYGGSPFGTLQIDDPAGFSGSIELGYGEALLQGILATSYSLKDDLLTLYGGTQIADQVHLSMEANQGGNGPQNFGVTATSSGVVIHADGAAGTGHAWASGTSLAQV